MTQSLDFSKIPPLSEDQIDQKSYKHEDLWMIHYKKQIYGPYHIDLMHKIAIKYTDELEMSSACNLARGKWYYLFDNKEFQNRTDQTFFRPVVIGDEQIHLYASEKESGPFDKVTVLAMLDKKELKHSDLFSIDSGRTWKKIYEIDGLDRRSKDMSEINLPDIPKVDAYSDEQRKFLDQTPNNHNVVLELKKIDPIIKKNKKTQSSHRGHRVRSQNTSSSASKRSSKTSLLLFIMIMVAAISWFMKDEISKLVFKTSPKPTNTIQRKNSKYKLQARKRKKPRFRPRSQALESSTDNESTRRVRQKEYNPSVEDSLELDNDVADSDNEYARSRQTRGSNFPRGTKLRSRRLNNDFVSEDDEAILRQQNADDLSNTQGQGLFLQTDSDEQIGDIDEEYLIPSSEFSDLDSENFVPLNTDEDEYYDSEEIYE